MTGIMFLDNMMSVMIIGSLRRKNNGMTSKPSVLVAGAAAGIGATYAGRLAWRRHDFAPASRSTDRLEADRFHRRLSD